MSPAYVRLAALVFTSCLAVGCEERSPVGPGADFGQVDDTANDARGDAAMGHDASVPPSPGEKARCKKADTSEPLAARSAVLSKEASAGEVTVFTRDLFSDFSSYCGGCHVFPARQGNFQVTLDSFPSLVDAKVVARIRSDDAAQFMPPTSVGGKPFSQRAAGDPVRELASRLEAWIAAGSPPDLYTVTVQSDGKSPYLMNAELGMSLTNLGSCIPESAMIATESQRSEELDELFASAKELPKRLEQTDLFTLDSATLARHGVVSFAPAYTLWSDDAKKMRYVRVPRGQSIRFDPKTQSFDMPPNTRFYKTFLKKVIDGSGQERYRKIETRIIVARPDRTLADGTAEPTALFGAYAWNEEETEAVLVEDPLHNGKPFRDRLVTVVLDEVAAKQIRDEHPDEALAYLEAEGLTRTHAIPGSERCIQCHMGDPTGMFVLGFTPLQLKRRPVGEGGVIEPAGPDELTQLDRLIDYGVITGMEKKAELVPLEKSQGQREPRNEHELTAQGYMLGNCAFCHNPRGFPTVGAPVLRELLNFYPSDKGGIFQFPLARTSPRITRGKSTLPVPYLSPSVDPDGTFKNRPVVTASGEVGYNPIQAPWRSLIYRNVDSPFTYADDLALFPHMPMNVAGFDCRARKLLGSWMVSIPARRKPEVPGVDTSLDPQPFEEIAPSDPDYQHGVSEAKWRIKAFLRSRGDVCENPPDIIDPEVVKGRALTPPLDPDGTGIPVRPHWVITDLTEAPGPYTPRREGWKDILVDGNYELISDKGKRAAQQKLIELLKTVRLTQALRSFALQEIPFGLWVDKPECDFGGVPTVSSFASGSRPRWFDIANQKNPDPKFADEPVYMTTRGAAVYTMICGNCHGPQADSRGRQADTVMLLTGGNTRVANFREGLFGPSLSPGQNRFETFGKLTSAAEGTAEDWAARYMVWMALGGTERIIPSAVLNVVASTPVLGEVRRNFTPAADANMLANAQALCRSLLPGDGRTNLAFDVSRGVALYDNAKVGTPQPPIVKNGDAELWEQLCTFENPMPIRVLTYPFPWKGQLGEEPQVYKAPILAAIPSMGVYFRSNPVDQNGPAPYPDDAPVGNHRGEVVQGVYDDNQAPWCIRKPSDPGDLAIARQFAQKYAAGGATPLPFCPDQLFTKRDGKELYRMDDAAIDAWVTRGAVTAGMSVFLYLEALSQGDLLPKPANNQCEQIPH